MSERYDPLEAPPEPPLGTWVKDRHGGTSLHQVPGGWGQPGIMPFGRWKNMWEARGPLVECGPWGADLPEPVTVEVEVQYWDSTDEDVDHEKNPFWIKEAMTSAVGRYWYDHHRTSPMADTITLTLDRERGVVVLTETPKEES